jgi:hypothetical protein
MASLRYVIIVIIIEYINALPLDLDGEHHRSINIGTPTVVAGGQLGADYVVTALKQGGETLCVS